MLYYLYSHFGINLFHYISVRAITGFFLAFLFTIFLMPKFIKWAKNKVTQPIYDLAPENHKKKSDTPTMGGVIFTTSAVFSTLITAKLNIFVSLSLITLIIFMLIGMLDDFQKIAKKDNQSGLSPRKKLILQSIAALIISSILYLWNFDTNFYIPFYKHPIFDMKIFAVFFWAFVIVGMSNAVNLTDGLDGLASVPSVFSLFTLTLFLYLSGNMIFSKYLFLPFENGIGEAVIVSTSLIGALLGFLWYNANPAEIFMGDSGSLSLGAIIALLAIFTKNEILLVFIGFIFVIETLSVMIQVGSLRTFNKRVFKMAPIHHHFEKLGWKENKVTIRFWIIAFITNLIAILSIKIR